MREKNPGPIARHLSDLMGTVSWIFLYLFWDIKLSLVKSLVYNIIDKIRPDGINLSRIDLNSPSDCLSSKL